MYQVFIKNNNSNFLIHDSKISNLKLKEGNITQGINSIDTFTFKILQLNIGFNRLYEFTTLVQVFNTKTNKLEFDGRILLQDINMEESGLIYKECTCESVLGFLCDSQQPYVEEKNWKTEELFNFILDNHNNQVEDYKKIYPGNITMLAPNDNIYLGIDRDNSWNTLKSKLLDKIGGEIKIYRNADNLLYIDYHEKIGEVVDTSIELRKNMKSLNKKNDPSTFVTRLIPLGAKIKEPIEDDSGVLQEQETEKRIGIESVNNGISYIDDKESISRFGIITGYQYWDDVTVPSNLLSKAMDFLEKNNKIQQSYSITALDLSLINLDFNSFETGNYYPVKNSLLNIDENLRIIKKTIDIINFTHSNFEIGDQEKSLSDIQINSEQDMLTKLTNIEANYAPNEDVSKIIESIKKQNSIIEQIPEKVKIEVSESFYTKEEFDEQNEKLEKAFESSIESTSKSIDLALQAKLDANKYTAAQILLLINDDYSESIIKADKISLAGKKLNLTSDDIEIASNNFNVDKLGNIIANDATLRSAILTGGKLDLFDDGTYDDASIRINTLSAYTEDIKTSSVLTDKKIYLDFSENSSWPVPSQLQKLASEYRTELITDSNNNKIYLRLFVNSEELYIYQLSILMNDSSEYETLLSFYLNPKTKNSKIEFYPTKEFQLSNNWGTVKSISSLPIASNIKLSNSVNRITSYSGYGIEANIFSDFDFNESDIKYVQDLITSKRTPTSEELMKYDINKDGKINALDLLKISKYVSYNITKTSFGKFIINTHDIYKNLQILDGNGNEKLALGLDGLSINGELIDFSSTFDYVQASLDKNRNINSTDTLPCVLVTTELYNGTMFEVRDNKVYVLRNGRVKINGSTHFAVTMTSNGNYSMIGSIYKNGKATKSVARRALVANANVAYYNSLPLPTICLDVKFGDYFELMVYCNRAYTVNADLTYLNIEEISAEK